MLRRYWIALAAIGLAATALLTVYGLTASLQYHQYNQREAAQARDEQTHYAYAEQVCGGEVVDLERIPCLVDAIQAAHQRDHDEADLRAQLDMSTWTFAMMWIGVVGIAVSIAGITLVYATLRETRNMTVATRGIGQDQVSAYAYVHAIRLIKGERGELPTIEITVCNMGQTAATNAQATCVVGLQLKLRGYTREAVAAGCTSTFARVVPKSEKLYAPLPDRIADYVFKVGGEAINGGHITVAGTLSYFNVFGEEFHTAFSFAGPVDKQLIGRIAVSKDAGFAFKRISKRHGEG